MITAEPWTRQAPTGDRRKRCCESGVSSNRTRIVSSTVPGVTIGPQDASPHAGQVVRRVLLRRNIFIDAETAQLVAAVQAALAAGAPSRSARRGPRDPAADCEPLS